MRWLVADTLSCPEQWFGSHLSAYSHYLREAGETVDSYCLNMSPREATMGEADPFPRNLDVVFALDRYDRCARWTGVGPAQGAKFVAQVAAITSPLPWEVRRADGLPAYDLTLSSLPWMVEAARATGARAEFMPLSFDLRCRTAIMGVKREPRVIFIGTRLPGHAGRERVLTELSDIVEVVPPVYGREFFRQLARSTVLVQPHLDWARGCANSMKTLEAPGVGCAVVYDGEQHGGWKFGYSCEPGNLAEWRDDIEDALEHADLREADMTEVLAHHTYECADRVPRLIELVRSLDVG